MSLTLQDTEVVFETIESGRAERALAGTDSIGCGYNVFGRYVDPKMTGQLLFDLGEYEKDWVSGYQKPERVRVQGDKWGEFEHREGSSSRSYQEELKTYVGLEGEYGFFQGEVEAEFEESHRRCSSFHFVSKTSNAYKYLLRLDDPEEFLTERAQADLAERDPEYLFRRYGTHYLNSLIIGGCAVFSSATNTASSAKRMDFSQSAELAYKAGVGSIKVKQGSEQYKQIETFNRNSRSKVRVRGGRPEFGEDILEGSYQKWIDSIEDDMDWVALPKVTETLRPIVPIWELCEDDKRREEIEAYFHEKYAPKFKPEPEPTIAPVYGYSVPNPQRWRYSLEPDLHGHGWKFHEKPFFYVSTEPDKDGNDGRVPVYMHSAMDPIRFKLSTEEHESGPQGPWKNDADPDGWTGATNPVWYAYPPGAGRGDDSLPIVGHTNPHTSQKCGWFYSEKGDDRNWTNEGIVFYAEEVKLQD